MKKIEINYSYIIASILIFVAFVVCVNLYMQFIPNITPKDITLSEMDSLRDSMQIKEKGFSTNYRHGQICADRKMQIHNVSYISNYCRGGYGSIRMNFPIDTSDYDSVFWDMIQEVDSIYFDVGLDRYQP